MKTSRLFSLLTFALAFCFVANINAQIDPKTVMKSKSMSLKDASGKNEMLLTFKSTSQESLDDIDLKEFKLVPILEDEDEEVKKAGLQNKSVSGDPGQGSPENMDVQKFAKTDHVNRVIQDVVFIDMQPKSLAPNVKALEVEFVSEGDPNAKPKGVTSKTVRIRGRYFFITYYRPQSHYIRVINQSYFPITTWFYYERNPHQAPRNYLLGTVDDYSGYAFKLRRNGWAWYRNCRYQVGALVKVGPYYRFKWRWSRSCRSRC